MKKYHLYLWFIALVGLITSCSQDEAAGPQNEASNRVRIGASIDQALQTRAASVTIPENHKLRYVLEVWSTGNVPTLICKYEKIAKDATAVEFTFDLTEAKDYKALLWADFVKDETGTKVDATGSLNEYTHYADHYYVTNSADGLKAVALAKTGADYVINDDARDAFFSCLPIKKETGAFADNVELKRPFGQINVIEKNTALRDNVASMTLTYNVPQTFNVETGVTAGTADAKPTVSTLPTATDARKANLFYDFIFTPAKGQTTLSEIKLTFTDNDQATNLNDFTIPAYMPVERNKRTNISGSILHTSTVPSTSAKLSVTVSDGWTTGDEDVDFDPKVGDYYYKNGTWSTENKATDSNPVIGVVYTVLSSTDSKYGKVRGRVVSLTEPAMLEWTTDGNEATTGATSTVDGKENTDKIFKGVAAGTYTLTNYPIFEACKKQRTDTGNDGWYIPSDYSVLFFSGYMSQENLTLINEKITAISGVGLIAPTDKTNGYWTSCERPGYGSYAYLSHTNNGSTSVSKSSKARVRFVLDF